MFKLRFLVSIAVLGVMCVNSSAGIMDGYASQKVRFHFVNDKSFVVNIGSFVSPGQPGWNYYSITVSTPTSLSFAAARWESLCNLVYIKIDESVRDRFMGTLTNYVFRDYRDGGASHKEDLHEQLQVLQVEIDDAIQWYKEKAPLDLSDTIIDSSGTFKVSFQVPTSAALMGEAQQVVTSPSTSKSIQKETLFLNAQKDTLKWLILLKRFYTEISKFAETGDEKNIPNFLRDNFVNKLMVENVIKRTLRETKCVRDPHNNPQCSKFWFHDSVKNPDFVKRYVNAQSAIRWIQETQSLVHEQKPRDSSRILINQMGVSIEHPPYGPRE